MKTHIRKDLQHVEPHHVEKSILEIEREVGQNVVQMGSNINPAGPSPFALKALFDNMGDVHHFPNSNGESLRLKVAEKFKVDPSHVLVGNNINSIARNILAVLRAEDTEVIAPKPCSPSVRRIVLSEGYQFKQVSMKDDFSYDIQKIVDAVSPKTRAVILSNPNNPLGTALTHEQIETLCTKLKEVVLIIDESSIEYTTAPDVASAYDLVEKHKNLVVLRTFSIIYGLAGLQSAYGFGGAEIVDAANRISTPYEISLLAEISSIAALEDDEHVLRSCEANKLSREIMEAGLKKLTKYQVSWVPTQGNYITVFLPILGDQFSEALLKDGFRVRSLSRYGLDNAVRITLSTRPSTMRCVYNMARLLGDLLGGES